MGIFQDGRYSSRKFLAALDPRFAALASCPGKDGPVT
jgi:hypothetical protein